MDGGIELKYDGFKEVRGRSDEVDKLAEKLMEKNCGYGKDWALIKKSYLKCTYGECLDKARREIYGSLYHPSLFR